MAASVSVLVLVSCSVNSDITPKDEPTTGLFEPAGTSAEQSAQLVAITTPTTLLNLRGSLDEKDGRLGPVETFPTPVETFIVPSLGPDETVAMTSITQVLDRQPQFEIKMAFAPGDGAIALSSALKDALKKAAPKGVSGHFHIDGHIDISSTQTGDTAIALTWTLRRANGQSMGEVSQTTTVNPSKIAGFWGDFARTAADPAARGITALVTNQSGKPANAS